MPDSTPAPTPSAADPVVVPFRAGPAAWQRKKQPPEGRVADERLVRLHFDVQFAGAKSAGRWEEDWPLLTEIEFDAALAAVANLKLGGR